MRLAVGIAVAIGVIVVIFLGLLAYSYTQIHVSLNDIKFHSIDWADISWSTLLNLGLNVLTGNWLGLAFDLIDGINLNLIFGFSNGGILPVYIPNLSYDLFISGVRVGSGYTNLDTTINPGETKEIPALQNFKKSSLAPAVSSIVANNGVIELRVRGTAYFELLWLKIPIPFESTKSISILDEIKQHLNSQIERNKPDSPNLKTSGQMIVDSIYEVPPGRYYYISIPLQCDARIQGAFLASATLGDNIIVYVFDEREFASYQNGESARTLYNSGKVESGRFDLYLNSGTYYVVLSNTYSAFSTKDVALQLAGQCN